jgi:hypothetical protein
MPLKILLDICLLRANPQDLPMSNRLMLAALIAYGLADVIGVLDMLSLGSAALAAAVDTLLLIAATHLALRWRNAENRFPQTLSALAGCGALLSLLAWAAAGLTREWLPPPWVWVPFLLWYILVFGHVLRNALSLALPASVAMSLLYIILTMGVTGLLINPAPVAN